MKTRKVILVLSAVLLLNTFISVSAEESEDDELQNDVASNDENEDENDEEYVDVEEENDVLVLTDDNFDEVVFTKDIILVEFYAPWCGHCKQLAPEYEKAAATLKENDPPVPLAKLDATVQTKVAQRFGVSGYPTLKFFKDGNALEYDGPRNEAGIVSFMKERADPSWKPPPESVLTLTKDNFTETISRESLILVEFYAPWCGHCKQLAPEYEKAAQYLKNEAKDKIPLAKVDATAEPELGQQYGVKGYPTIKVFRNGKPYEYKGERNKWGIIQYMEKQIAPPTTQLDSVKDIKKFMSNEDVTVIGFFRSSKDPAFEVFSDMANSNRDEYTMGHSFDRGAREHYNAEPNSVLLFFADKFQSKYEPKQRVFKIESDTEYEAVTEFLHQHEVPLVGHLSMATKEKRYMKRKPLVLWFFDVDWGFDHRDATQANRRKALEVAKDYKDLTFALADEQGMKEYFMGFGFDESAEDLNIGILGEGDSKYPMEPMEEYDADELREFLDAFTAGKLKPRLKSQKSVKDKGPVKNVIGKTFYDVVHDEKKDVLIEFYAPWCGHCKKLDPIYTKLAKKLKTEKNLVIAKMDATANDAPAEYKVEGFPTIYFSPAGKKGAPMKYDDDRNLEGLEKFVKEHSTASFLEAPPAKEEKKAKEPEVKWSDEL